MSRHGSPARRRDLWQAFRHWRRTRPFWGGVFTLLAGAVIIAAPLLNPLDLIIEQGIAGISGYFVGILLMAVGVLAWFQPPQRFFYGIVAILLALVSFVTSNFGGFLFGMLFGLVGGALTIAWMPQRRRRAGPDPGPGPESEPGPESGSVPSDPPAPDPQPQAGDRPDAGSGPASGGRLHSLAALPAALVLVFSAPAPALIDWPWDDWFGGGDEEESTSEPAPSPSPSADPSASPPEQPGGEEDQESGEDSDEEGTDEEGTDEEDADEEKEVSEECTVQEGASAVGEDELRTLLEACQQAQESGEVPEFSVKDGDGRFTAGTAESGLTADKLTMSGASFDGVVRYPTSDGQREYIKMSMDTAEFEGASQWFDRGGATTTLDIPSMTMSGDVVMHVTRMEVRILGIKLTFTPDFPPPLLLPYMVVTDLDVAQPLAQADNVSISALNEQVEA